MSQIKTQYIEYHFINDYENYFFEFIAKTENYMTLQIKDLVEVILILKILISRQTMPIYLVQNKTLPYIHI